MSYGDEPATLDFASIHLASLSGDNGNGKSALLDAMTYALWGKTRASGSQSSGEDDLIRLGADDMEVQLEFMIEEDTYRATRRRSRRARSGDWQLHMLDGHGEWRPAGGSSMAETGRHLSRLLRMEYETFLNSAYIQQGRADEFTRQKPNDRKRILGDILDLRRYDRLEEMARERRTDCDLALKDLDGEIRHLEARVAEGRPAEEKLAVAEREAARAAEARTASTGDRHTRAEELARLEAVAAGARDLESRVNAARQDLDAVDLRIVTARTDAERAAALLAREADARAEFERLTECRRVIHHLQPSVDRANALQQERAALQAAIDVERQKLVRDLDRAAAESRRLEMVARQIQEIDHRLAEMAPKLAHFASALPERDQARDALSRAQERFTEMAAVSKRLKGDIAETEEVVALLGEPKPSCPVCASDLTGGRQQAVLLKQKNRLDSLKERLAEVNHEGAMLKRERDGLQRQIETLEEQIRSEAALRAQRAELAANRERLCREAAERESVVEAMEELRRKLEAEDYAVEGRERLAAVEAEAAGLAGDLQRHAAAAASVRELTARNVEERMTELRQAAQVHATAMRELARLQQERESLSTRADQMRSALTALLQQSAGIEAARAGLREADERLQRAVFEYDLAHSQVARFTQTIEDCARAAAQLEAKRAERDRLGRDKQAYTDLAAAFGKRGVQAHIIDNALPEIQEEANRLLARLTDSAMQITLSTLRQARAGSSQIETLDISITDEAGTRPYEMYSGGEAFRVNFAIRIALSRVLARRAGAGLQTLILDEGFGTQDAKGRERLVEAIEAVKDEFSLILVISHIEELKDAFPTRIEVTKTPSGSQVTFVE